MTRVEQLMGEIVDILAADPGRAVDPRAWAQLLIYAPGEEDGPVFARVVQHVVVTARNIALDGAIVVCQMFEPDGSAAQCVAALRDVKAMMNPGEQEARQ